MKVANVINPAGNAVEPNSVNTSAFLSDAAMDANGIMTFNYATKEAGAYTLGIITYMLGDSDYKDKAAVPAIKQWANLIISPACTDLAPDFIPITGNLKKYADAAIAKLG